MTDLTADLTAAFDPAEIRALNAAGRALGVPAAALIRYTFALGRLGEAVTAGALVAEYRSATADYTS